MNLREIVTSWLAFRKYDGLFNTDSGCACRLDNLMPCDEPGVECMPGYLEQCPGPESEVCDGDCEFHIVAVRSKEENRR